MTRNRRTFLGQLSLGAAGVGLVSFVPGCGTLEVGSSNRNLPRSTPEASGVASTGVLDFLDAAAKGHYELHSLMLVRHGRVVAEGWWTPYAAEFNHGMYSMSKSFTSTAVGLAVAEGKLRVEDQVVSFFPDDLPAAVSENLAALRVKHLLTMSVGHGQEPTMDMVKQENWVRAFLAWPITHPPGSVFLYNSAATYMLSAIVQRLTGQRVVDYLQPRLFDPLGIEGPTWETCPRGINVGGWGLSIRTEGLAKFGQLYLQKGQWAGRQVLPAEWVEEATTFKIQQPIPSQQGRPQDQNDWLQGYCYQFWRSTHKAFRGDGAFGQFTLVLPEQDAVVVMTSESRDLQGQLDLVWKHLLPALHDQPLALDVESADRLRQRLASLSLPPPQGSLSSPMADRLSGKSFDIENNDLGLQGVTFGFLKDVCVMTFRGARGEYPIVCGLESWRRGEISLPGTPPRLISGGAPRSGTRSKVAAGGAWKDDRTFEAVLRYYETPHHDTVTCRFDKDTLTITFMNSMAQDEPDSQGQPASAPGPPAIVSTTCASFYPFQLPQHSL